MSFTSFDFPHTHFYESDLRELIAFYKELQDKYDGLVADVKALQDWKEQHEGEYEELLERVRNIENEIDTFESEVERMFAELSAAFDERFNSLSEEIRAELAREIESVEEQFNALKSEIENEIAQMKLEIGELSFELAQAISTFRIEMADYIDEKFDLFIQSLPDYEHLMVHNPIRGYQTTIQVAIDDLYSASNFWGLTAGEFDSLELTCEEFDNKGLTAHEFDTLGYKLFGYPDPNYYMRDPFSGEIIPVKDVVMKLYGLHAGGDTAGEFDARDLTAEEFDAIEITAFQFDFYGISA